MALETHTFNSAKIEKKVESKQTEIIFERDLFNSEGLKTEMVENLLKKGHGLTISVNNHMGYVLTKAKSDTQDFIWRRFNTGRPVNSAEFRRSEIGKADSRVNTDPFVVKFNLADLISRIWDKRGYNQANFAVNPDPIEHILENDRRVTEYDSTLTSENTELRKRIESIANEFAPQITQKELELARVIFNLQNHYKLHMILNSPLDYFENQVKQVLMQAKSELN